MFGMRVQRCPIVTGSRAPRGPKLGVRRNANKGTGFRQVGGSITASGSDKKNDTSSIPDDTTSSNGTTLAVKPWDHFINPKLWNEGWLYKYMVLRAEFEKDYFKDCIKSVHKLRTNRKKVYPPDDLVFEAFRLTPLDKIKAVIVGQDPYHQPRQAMGLAFSVPKDVTVPPSLRNIYKELGHKSRNGDLRHWAKQGVFLLNTMLTVVDSTPMAHKDFGWQEFTDAVISIINQHTNNIVFLLWGKSAQIKGSCVDRSRHLVLESGHPSPLSQRYFLGCNHFKLCNEYLEGVGKNPIVWSDADSYDGSRSTSVTPSITVFCRTLSSSNNKRTGISTSTSISGTSSNATCSDNSSSIGSTGSDV